LILSIGRSFAPSIAEASLKNKSLSAAGTTIESAATVYGLPSAAFTVEWLASSDV
jgi:hypothetical protein